MPNPTAPVKTPLGLNELRHRTRGLGQRYRTILLLVDGRRPLGEVLGMAHKAGAQTSHFEELVRLGLVEVPEEIAAPEPMETAPGGLDTPRLTSVELDVFAEAALTPMGELLPETDAALDAESERVALGASDVGCDEEPAGDAAAGEPFAVASEEGAETPPPLPMIAVSTLAAEPAAPPPPPPLPAARAAEAQVVLSATPRQSDWAQQVRETPFKVADHARPAPRMTEAQRLQYVRDLLHDTLRRDSLLFATFSTGRVKGARSQNELIRLVWEIERDRTHNRRTREQLLNLQRARELLGMGNTLVSGDSQPGPISDF